MINWISVGQVTGGFIVGIGIGIAIRLYLGNRFW